MKRIAIIGITGSGKTTLAEKIAARLDILHVEIDALNWEPDWQPAEKQVLRQRVDSTLSADGCWVCDGNYSAVRDIVWQRADTVIWLNYPLHVSLWRVTSRTLKRIITRQLLWGTNRETLRDAFFSGDSLVMWAIKTYPEHQIKYPAQFALPEHAHLTVIRLKSPVETQRWLAALSIDSP